MCNMDKMCNMNLEQMFDCCNKESCNKESCNKESCNKSNLDPFNTVNDVFKLPIFYNSETKILNDFIINDLELLKTIELDVDVDVDVEKEDKPIYNYVFNPTSSLAKKVLEVLPTFYTTDTQFLNETQMLTESLSFHNDNDNDNDNDKEKEKEITNLEIEETIVAWKEIKSDTGFCNKYLYIDWDFGKFLNNNSSFLQVMSLYNVGSPILSLCMPIMVLIIPFFVIKTQGHEINVKEYTDNLLKLISEHALIKIFTSFHEVDLQQKIWLLVSAAFYLFSIYQNILVCIRFYSNINKIHDYLFKMNKYIKHSILSMEYYLTKSKKLVTYCAFNETITSNLVILKQIHDNINIISPLSLSSITESFLKISEIGHIMHTFYQFYDNKEYTDTILYSFGFNGYIHLLTGLKKNIDSYRMNKATFSKTKNIILKKNNKDKKGLKEKHGFVKPTFKKMYYPKFIDYKDAVANDCTFDKNIIITGPNASGKTTILKSALINIILSQQTGFGCFESLDLYPYDKFHCYLNIPDTSGRDSLFQAEARRCKEIMECITVKCNKEDTHFCIFDEIYSGTNPEEAVSSAKQFMKNIVKNNNVSCLLTTHYVKLCKKLAKNDRIMNCNMKTKPKINDNKNCIKDDFDYTYKMEEGISTVKGGAKIISSFHLSLPLKR